MSLARVSKPEPIAEQATRLFSDDECVRKLAMLLEHRETKNLAELAALIGRLTPTIE